MGGGSSGMINHPNSTDVLFIKCDKPECFPEHDFTEEIQRISVCKFLIGKIQWSWD